MDRTLSFSAFEETVSKFRGVKVLVLGDLILDRFLYGFVNRVSPEAPVPILHAQKTITVLGGAANVGANIVSLGGSVVLLGGIGRDAEGDEIQALCESLGIDTRFSRLSKETSTKTRFVAHGQQVLRCDVEDSSPIPPNEAAKVFELFQSALSTCDIVVLSDYAKGILVPELIQKAIQACKNAGKPILVDPKGEDYTRYRGATFIKPNIAELSLAIGHRVVTDEDIEFAARQLIAELGLQAMVVTKSERGIAVVTSTAAVHRPTEASEVFDVSGAGDTVMASLCLAVGTGLPLAAAAGIANAAAGIVVSKIGTAQVSAKELLDVLSPLPLKENTSLASLPDALKQIADWKSQGLTIGFTNGCFDLLHPGHVALLRKAASLADRLVVGLNSDASVQRLKGATRPIVAEGDRAAVLCGLSSVDIVVAFDEDTPLSLIKAVNPDILIKGADYSMNDVVGAPFVIGSGGRVELVDLVPGKSTSKIQNRILATSSD